MLFSITDYIAKMFKFINIFQLYIVHFKHGNTDVTIFAYPLWKNYAHSLFNITQHINANSSPPIFSADVEEQSIRVPATQYRQHMQVR